MCFLKRERLLLKDVIIFRNNDDQIDMEKKKLASHIIYPQIKRFHQLMFSCSNEKEKYLE